MENEFFYSDLKTHKIKRIDEAKLNKEIDKLIPLIERMATKLKKIDDGTLSGFEINIGITAGVPVLYATGGLTLTYKVS